MQHPRALIDRFAVISTGTLSDVLDGIGLRGVLTGIHGVGPNMKIAGPAVTVKEVSGDIGAYSLPDFRVGEIIQQAGPGDVLVVDNAGQCVSTWGFLASLSSKSKGLGGIVINGGVRDIREISELNFPVFARHAVPLSGKRRIRIESINKTISIQDVAVRPGDMVRSDDTGVVVVPAERCKEVLEEAERLEGLERGYVPLIRAGVSLSDLASKHGHV
jgi:regulator of RNase E activity RraA